MAGMTRRMLLRISFLSSSPSTVAGGIDGGEEVVAAGAPVVVVPPPPAMVPVPVPVDEGVVVGVAAGVVGAGRVAEGAPRSVSAGPFAGTSARSPAARRTGAPLALGSTRAWPR